MHKPRINHDFSLIGEVDGDPATDIGLHLTIAPFRTVGMAYDDAGRINGRQITHRGPLTDNDMRCLHISCGERYDRKLA